MAKQLNVSLAFTADISQAKRQIQELQTSLENVAKMPGKASSLFDDVEIKKASKAALELQQHLAKAVNIDTGKLDLSRFSSSLKNSNKDLHQYATTLMSIGSSGQQAFLQLAQAIATADTPVTRINAKVAELGTTLKNTARWQISSSILHGFMGAVQSAYGYAQDLNRSLNDIRIVTGQNIDEMATFAEKANRAAKALSTTTTEYTNASLIYYQQGLNDEEVQKRTDITVKMANAAGESAEKVSDQLTAVWNNFYDGTKSLEYYADVMTALGAATASSTDEIAGGLEKFAAIGETIGLSYEYAASALATITSNTRQSEDVVGTALKTIFARIQGLKLGESLEDGVDLNKYSEALQSVGISIFESTGELKNMDNILNEMAAKWNTMSNAQQTALAQTVAGVRQYTQLVALMENWNNGDSDSMMANLETSYNATGALQEQADIYAESWEAAQDRVTAAAENIYDSLINDEFFIDLLNGFEKVLETIGGFIDGLGGMKGIVLTIGSIFMNTFARQMPETLNNLRQNLMVFTGQATKEMKRMQSNLNVELLVQKADPRLSEGYKLQIEGISKVNQMKQKLVIASKNLTDSERAEYQAKINNVKSMYEETALLAKKKEELQKIADQTQKLNEKKANKNIGNLVKQQQKEEKNIIDLEDKATDPTVSENMTQQYEISLEAARKKAEELKQSLSEIQTVAGLTDDELQSFQQTGQLTDEAYNKVKTTIHNITSAYTQAIQESADLENISASIGSQANAWNKVAEAIKKAQAEKAKTKDLEAIVDSTKQKMQQYLQVLQKLAKEKGIENLGTEFEDMQNDLDKMDISNIDQIIGKFTTFSKTIQDEVDLALKDLDNTIDDLETNLKTLQFNDKDLQEMEKHARGAADGARQLDDVLDNIEGIADEPIKSTFKLSSAITEAGSLAMSVSSMITGIQSAISVFGDESASGFEKLGAALSLIMPLMTTFNSLQQLSTILSNQDTIVKTANAMGLKIVSAFTKKNTAVKMTETGAVWANNAAWYASPILWIGVIILGVVAAIAALVGGISALSKEIVTTDEKAEMAANAVESLTTQFEDCKKAADDFRQSVSSWDEGVKALEEMDKTTDEYKEKLKEVNAQAKELIETYGLYDDYETVGGVIQFKKDSEGKTALDTMQAEKDAAVQNSEIQLSAAKITKNNADIQVQAKNTAKDLGLTANQVDMSEVTASIDAVIADKSKDLPEGESFELSSQQILDALKEGSYGLPQVIADNLDKYTAEDIESIMKFRESMNEATEANKYYAEQIMKTQVEDQYGSIYKAAATGSDGKVDEGLYQSMLNAGAKQASENTTVDGKSLEQTLGEIDVSKVNTNAEVNSYVNPNDPNGKNYNIKNDEDLAKTYARDVLGWDEDAISYSGGTNKGSITNTATGDSFEDLDDDFMRQALAKQSETIQATQDFNNKLGETMLNFNTALTNTVTQAKDGIAQIIVDAAGSDSKEIDYDSMMAEISPEDMESMQGLSSEELMTKLGLTNENLTALGLESGEEFLAGFNEAAANYNPEDFYANMKDQAAASAGSKAKEAGFSDDDTEDIQNYAKHLMEIADESDELSDELDENAEAAANLSVQVAKMNRGIDKLADGFDDWKDVLKKSSKESMEYANAMSDVKDALSDVLGVESEFISNDFVTENLSLIEQAATGSANAIEDLQDALAEDIMMNIAINNGIEEQGPQLTAQLQSLKDMLPDLEVGASIDISNMTEDEKAFVDACNKLIADANMTAEQATAAFKTIGFEPKFKTTVKEETAQKPTITTRTTNNSHFEGEFPNLVWVEEKDTTSWTSGYTPVKESYLIPALSTDGTEPQVETITKLAPPSFNNYSSSNKGGKAPGSKSGGSKSKPKKADKAKKSDIVERYKEINDELKETQHLLSKNDAEMEGLWGEARFKKMREGVKILKQENAQLEERLKWSKEYLKSDKSDLQKAASAAGINLQFDEETGRIINYTEEVTKLYKELDAAINAANADGNVTEEEQEKIDKIQEKIDAVNDAKDQYDATLNEIQSDEEKWLENRNEIWTKNFEELNEKLELRITINESDLEILEYYLGKIEDDAYASTEAFGLYNKEFAAYTDNLHAQEDYYAELRQQLEAGEISMAQYKEGLQQAQSDTLANAEALRELKIEMQDYYGNVIAQSIEDLALYTDQMEHLNSVLDHYSSIMDIVGKQQDYEAKGKILSGKANNVRNELDTYKKEYEMYNAEAEEWKKKMDSAAAGSNEYETYKKNWIAAQEAANNAQDNMLSKTEEWAEAMRACVENELDGLAKELEEDLTGGTSFDTMLTTMERANSLQEEYLTTTNKIYETNKLMNQAQQEIDKTNNSVAKRKLKGFIEETNQLQKQGKLSQFELEIQQAKYDLLLAEIALEEAQQAKSTVRLQRDSEGNFGYVYTADSSQIAEAEQKLVDAQNNLYNIGLEGANNYNQKYAETMQEMYDTLTDLQKQYLEGAFATEQEYQDAVTAAKEYYYAKLEDYSALHTVALSTDSRIVADAWSSDFSDMMGKTEEWKDCIDEYSIDAAESLSTWTEVVSTVLEDSGLDDVDSAVNDITVESNNLKDAIIGEDGNGGLVSALQSEIAEAGRLSEGYITLQNEIDKTITAHEKLVAELNQEFKNPTATEGGSGSGSGGSGSGSGGNNDGTGSDSSSSKDGIVSVGDEVTYTGGYYYNTSQGDTPKGDRGPNKKVKVTRVLTNGAPYPIAVESSDSAYGWLKKEQLSGFDTGGYTGAWGSYGKMAMLHEKELVLNKQDTENFLTSMEFLDNIIKTIDLQAANSALGGLLNSPSFGDFGQKEILEQNVKIEASFPNVQNRTEIEEAFETLINQASQYANRR